MNPQSSPHENHLFSYETFPEPSTPEVHKVNHHVSSPFSQFCINALSPIPTKRDSPQLTPLQQRTTNTQPKLHPLRHIQKINFAEVESKLQLQASCVSVEIKVISDSIELPKIRPRKKTVDKTVCCNCQKSRCLKLYCDCFAVDHYCINCSCIDCLNRVEFEDARKDAISSILEKNPDAFKPKIFDTKDMSRHLKGCNCKRSGCMKRYCECYQSNIKCSEICKCIGCNNKDTGLKGKRKSRKIVKKM
ncbi:hypothetical protein SteCoe_25661 [Stentor coeruleus]|uniref:CRC domain-containing protein n=1 Tax=Stentor coeruleus TaxID=5963 RepID=A0A1R2BEV9_9CILI|nr:hypothetical protein SteCoe_25661 [Stentor coeruleus]